MASKTVTAAELAAAPSFELPQPITAAEAVAGTIVTILFDEDGKLFRIDGPRPGTKIPTVNLTGQDGRKSYARTRDLQKSARVFNEAALPSYVPKPGEFVTTDKVRNVKADTPWIVTKLTGPKATIMMLDGSGIYANVPFAVLTPAEVTVTVKA